MVARRTLETWGDVDRVALELMPALHGLSVAQARLVLERCQKLVAQAEVFDADAALRQWTRPEEAA